MTTRTRPDRAALAFSALPADQAQRVAKDFTIVERTRLRESLARVRTASDAERREALQLLLEAVRAPVTFPVPLAHEEERCAFRTLEEYEPVQVAAGLVRLGAEDRLLVAVALCHFSEEFREQVWAVLPGPTRTSTRSLLAQVPAIGHARTRRHAQDLAKRVASDSVGPRATG